MIEQELSIEQLENQFPLISGSTFAAARQKALDSGLSVLQSEDGFIYEVFPDGTRKMIKVIEPPTSVTPGTKIAI